MRADVGGVVWLFSEVEDALIVALFAFLAILNLLTVFHDLAILSEFRLMCALSDYAAWRFFKILPAFWICRTFIITQFFASFHY